MENMRFRGACLLVLAASVAVAQPGAPPKFDVASIKPAAGDPCMCINTTPGGRVRATSMTLKFLVQMVYRVQDFQVSGGPPWFDSLRYDIEAKSDPPPKESEVPVMLQQLLADRFQLVFHRETRELPVYALVLARKDGKPGPGMVESKEGSCTPPDPAKPSEASGKPDCGQGWGNARMLRSSSVQMDYLATSLSRLLRTKVIDQTGLTGKYDLKLDWTPDERIAFSLPPDAAKAAAESGLPDLFGALPQQLGLKLESRKEPVEVLVIDRAEKPSEN
jgi:uncharacterized protein (TIGR03435 family)